MEKQNRIVAGLTFISLVALVAAYFAPIWWVSLTAPNYPPDAFPDGIRIHFHFDGVYNGCKAAGKGTRMAGESSSLNSTGSSAPVRPRLNDEKRKLASSILGRQRSRLRFARTRVLKADFHLLIQRDTLA